MVGGRATRISICLVFLNAARDLSNRRSPISIDQSGSQFTQSLADRNFKGVRVAMFKDMGLPWEQEVKDAVQAQRKVFEGLGCIVEEAEPDFSDANECFVGWRHWSVEAR